jgi:hypothetical protein
MMPDNARKILGVPRTAKKKAIDQVYHNQCKALQVQMRPGNPITVRKQAQAQLVQITAAWNTLNRQPFKPPAKSSPAPRSTPKINPHYTSRNRGPVNLANVWERVFSLIPLPRPLVIAVTAAVVVTMLTLLISKM